MNLNNIQNEQKKLLKMLEAFDAYCQEHQIQYFLYAGTMLGAVREKGFIPWDGDIDIMMSYPEYKKLNEVASKTCNINGYKWVTYETDKNIPTLFGKIFESNVNANSLENYSYIEVCPYTGVPDNKLLQTIIWKMALLNYNIYWVKNRLYHDIFKRKHSLIGMIGKIMFMWWPSILSIKIFKFLCENWNYETANKAIYLTALYGPERQIIPTSYLNERSIYIKFENKLFPIINQWDKFLKQMYGNYTIPVQYDRYKA